MFKLSRNNDCWCGSGEKYKRCHIEHDEKLNAFKREGFPIPSQKLLKTTEQIEGIRKACKLTKSILDSLNDIIKSGISTEDIDKWVHDQIIAGGATPACLGYKGFPKSCCTSINEVICHGIPTSSRILEEGDFINVDLTSILNGYYGDSCRMYAVGNISKEAQKLSDVTKECLDLAIKAVKPFQPVHILGDIISDHAESQGYSVVEIFGGHGIGIEFHEDPFIYHCRTDHKQMIMAPNMTFTIEPMINAGKPDAKILDDGWTAVTEDGSLSAQWEHTLLVTETGAEVLT